MKEILKTFERIGVYYVFSIIIGFIFSLILDIPVKFLLRGSSDVATLITDSVTTLTVMIFVFFSDGYHYKKFEPKKIIISLCIVLVLMELFTASVSAASFITGPTTWITNIIFSTDFAKQSIATYLCNMLFLALAFVFVYSPIILLFEYLGVKSRKKDSEEFLREQREHPAINEKH